MIEYLLLAFATHVFVVFTVLRRNHLVCKKRLAAVCEASRRARRDIERGKVDWSRHYNAYDHAAGYLAMLLIFWRPVSSWDKELGLGGELT